MPGSVASVVYSGSGGVPGVYGVYTGVYTGCVHGFTAVFMLLLPFTAVLLPFYAVLSRFTPFPHRFTHRFISFRTVLSLSAPFLIFPHRFISFTQRERCFITFTQRERCLLPLRTGAVMLFLHRCGKCYSCTGAVRNITHRCRKGHYAPVRKRLRHRCVKGYGTGA